MSAAERRPFPFFVAGLLLLAAAGILSSVAGTNAYLTRLLALAGLAAIGWALVRSFADLRVAFARARRVAEPGPGLTWVLAAAVLLVASIGLGMRTVRYDLTARGLQSLSPASKEAIGRDGAAVELIGVYRGGSGEAARAADILRIYEAEGSGVSARMLDPDRDPDAARRLAIAFSSGVLVRADSVSEVVTELDEPSLTQAILRVRDPERPVAAILEGHGEIGPERSALREFGRMLAQSGFEVRRLPLAEMEGVPPEVRVLFVVGPQTELLPGEIVSIERFVNAGGRLGIFVDPGTATGLETALRRQGVVVGGGRVRDEGPLTRTAGVGPEAIAVRSLGEHALTRGLHAAIVLRGATRAGLQPTPIWGIDAVEVLLSAPSAEWIGVGGEAGDADARRSAGVADPNRDVAAPRPGSPIPLAVALEWEPGGAAADSSARLPEQRLSRILVVGDSDVLRDDTIGLYGNADFVRHAAGWLGDRRFLLRFREVDASGTPLRVGYTGLRTVFYIVQLLIPLSMMAFGILVWVRRR